MTEAQVWPAYTDTIRVRDDGQLCVEALAAADLAARFGTPLYVVSERQLRLNYRRFSASFARHYPDVLVAYGAKANNGRAVMQVLRQEGAGAECFGQGELQLALSAGIDPRNILLNGSDKQDSELAAALSTGVTVNVDNPEELERIEATAADLGCIARINLRVKVPLQGLASVILEDYRYRPPQVSLSRWALEHKFGMTLDEARTACGRTLGSPRLQLHGLHYHLKGQTPHPEFFGVMARELIDFAGELHRESGWAPAELDLGGGFSYGRAEGYGPAGRDRAVPDLDDYAAAMAGSILAGCERQGLPLPRLVLEPGRLLVASAALLLTRVGTVKRHAGVKTWVHVDASINHAIRTYTGNWYYHIVPSRQDGSAPCETVTVVGPLCDAADILGRDRDLPLLQRGDLLAILDVGAYAESAASNFNTQPKPATVLVNGAAADVITARESVEEVIGRHRVPVRLLGRPAGEPS